MKRFNLDTQAWEEDERPPTALERLQAEYRGEIELTANQRRSAIACLAFESPKLAVTAYLSDAEDFAARLERALARSHPKVIEHRPEPEPNDR